MPHNVLDKYYLAITLLITIAYQLFFFSIAWTLHFDKLTDFAGGTNFVVLAIITLALSGPTGDGGVRQITASVFMMVWGLRLSGFLLFRILKTGAYQSGSPGQVVAMLGAKASEDAIRHSSSMSLVQLTPDFRTYPLRKLMISTGKDDRFDDKRNKFFPFLGFWIFQVS